MKTIIDFFDPPILRLCLLIFIAMTGLAGYNWIAWSCLTPSDWAAWVGAVGTVGTLIGTIWLATAADRRRRREECSRAVIAAHALQLRITSAWSIAREVKESLENESIRGFQYAAVADWIEGAALWTDEEVLPLMVLPRNVAAELVATRDLLLDCARALGSNNPRKTINPARSLDIERNTIRNLGHIDESFDMITSECKNYLQRTMRVDF